MYRKLEQHLKDSTANNPLYMVNSTFVPSNRIVKGDEEEYDRLRDRASMTLSMDPMMLQQHLKDKPLVTKLSYKKKASGSSEGEKLKTEGG